MEENSNEIKEQREGINLPSSVGLSNDDQTNETESGLSLLPSAEKPKRRKRQKSAAQIRKEAEKEKEEKRQEYGGVTRQAIDFIEAGNMALLPERNFILFNTYGIPPKAYQMTEEQKVKLVDEGLDLAEEIMLLMKDQNTPLGRFLIALGAVITQQTIVAKTIQKHEQQN